MIPQHSGLWGAPRILHKTWQQACSIPELWSGTMALRVLFWGQTCSYHRFVAYYVYLVRLVSTRRTARCNIYNCIYILWVKSVSHPGTHLNMLGYINDSCSILARIKMIKHHRISQTWKRNSSQQHATSQRSQNLSKQTWKTHGKTSQNTSSLHCVGGREEVESCRKKSWSGRPGSSCRCWSSRCIRFTNAGYSVRERKSSKASECMASSTKCSSKVFAWTKPQSINAFCIVSSACASNCWNNVNHSAFCSLFITSAFSKSAKAGQFAEKKWSTKLLHSEATNPITWSCLAMFQLIDLVGWEGDWCKGLQQA